MQMVCGVGGSPTTALEVVADQRRHITVVVTIDSAPVEGPAPDGAVFESGL